MIPIYADIERDAKRYPPITLSIIFVCFIIFILDFLSEFKLRNTFCPGGPVSHVLEYEPWKLLTNIFFHNDILHLVANMTCLYVFGKILESSLPKILYILLLTTAGVLGSYSFLYLHETTNLLLGFSGAAWGMYFPMIWFFSNVRLNYIYTILGVYPIPVPIVIFGKYLGRVAIFIMVELYLNSIFFVSSIFNIDKIGQTEIAFEAHFAGFIVGFILTMAYVLICKLNNKDPINTLKDSRKISQ